VNCYGKWPITRLDGLQGAGGQRVCGALSPLSVITIGGVPAMVKLAGLDSSRRFQFKVVVPASLADWGRMAVPPHRREP